MPSAQPLLHKLETDVLGRDRSGCLLAASPQEVCMGSHSSRSKLSIVKDPLSFCHPRTMQVSSLCQQSKHTLCFTRPGDSSPRDSDDKGEAAKVKLGQRPCQQLRSSARMSQRVRNGYTFRLGPSGFGTEEAVCSAVAHRCNLGLPQKAFSLLCPFERRQGM